MPAAPSSPLVATPEAAAAAHRSRWWRCPLMLGLFCAGLFAAGAAVDRVLPFPPVPTVKEKLDWLAFHGDEYDTLFIGSSRTNGHILPEIFDRLMAQAGTPTHSFNLGVNGMRPPEDTCLLEQALARRKTPLKWVIAELNAIPLSTEDNTVHGTLRAVWWRDAKRFRAVCRAIAERGFRHKFPQKLEALQYTLETTLSHALCIGRGRQALEACFAKPASSSSVLGPRCDGSPMYGAPVDAIAAGEWASLQTRLEKPPRFRPKNRASQAELREKRRLAEAAGARLVTFSAPLAGIEVMVPDPAFNPDVPYLNFARPALYPELFARENRLDSGHLNRAGAELFTRRLAEALIEAQKPGGAPPGAK